MRLLRDWKEWWCANMKKGERPRASRQRWIEQSINYIAKLRRRATGYAMSSRTPRISCALPSARCLTRKRSKEQLRRRDTNVRAELHNQESQCQASCET